MPYWPRIILYPRRVCQEGAKMARCRQPPLPFTPSTPAPAPDHYQNRNRLIHFENSSFFRVFARIQSSRNIVTDDPIPIFEPGTSRHDETGSSRTCVRNLSFPSRDKISMSKIQRVLNGVANISSATSREKIFAPHCVSHTGTFRMRRTAILKAMLAMPRPGERCMSAPRCGHREPMTAFTFSSVSKR